MSKNAKAKLEWVRENNACFMVDMRQRLEAGDVSAADYRLARQRTKMIEIAAQKRVKLEEEELRRAGIADVDQPVDASSTLDDAEAKALAAFKAGIAHPHPEAHDLAKCAAQLRSALEDISAVRRLVEAKQGCGMTTISLTGPFAGFVS